MASFFEKLKKGMGDEEGPIEEKIEKPKKLKRVKSRAKKQKQVVADPKLEIKNEEIESTKLTIKSEEPKKTTPPKENPERKSVENKEKWFEPEGQLAIDVYQTNEELIIQSAIAGVKPDSLDISIEGDMVLIKGRREKPNEEAGKSYFYQECYWGPFSRQIILSVEVDPSRAEADLKEGILTIKMPKIEREKKRKISVKG